MDPRSISDNIHLVIEIHFVVIFFIGQNDKYWENKLFLKTKSYQKRYDLYKVNRHCKRFTIQHLYVKKNT